MNATMYADSHTMGVHNLGSSTDSACKVRLDAAYYNEELTQPWAYLVLVKDDNELHSTLVADGCLGEARSIMQEQEAQDPDIQWCIYQYMPISEESDDLPGNYWALVAHGLKGYIPDL